MQRKMIYTILLVFVVVGLTGCRKNIEQPTPPGQVAPPIQPIQAQPYRNPNAATPYRPAQAAQAQVSDLSSTSGTGEKAKPLMNPEIIGTFQQTYKQAGEPRLAIFLNRSLSDEVREWHTQNRLVTSVSGHYEKKSGDVTETFTGPGGAAVYGQTHMENPERSSPGESWMWRFEDGFLAPFLETGTKIVDRATIMRLTAAQSGTQGSAYAPMAVKKIEMDALTDKADLFIEILIRRAPASKLGYEFKASAKDIKTGFIRANVTSFGWDYKTTGKTNEKVVATATGYEFVKETQKVELPEVNVIARDLALALMQSLAGNWRQ